jgi:hypothetical protein
MQCQGEPKDNPPPPYKTRRGVHALQVQPPPPKKKKHSQNNTLTVYLVDVVSADHCDRAHRPGPKQNLEKKAKPNFQGNVSRTKACTVVVSSSPEESLMVGKEVGKGWGGVREREDAHVQ